MAEHTETKPPSQSWYRWVVLAIGVAAQSSFAALAQGLPAIGPSLHRQLHLTLTQSGALLTAASLGGSVTMFAWGLVADRIGERAALTIGLTGAATATTLAAFAKSYPTLLAWLIIAGLCGACSSAATGRAVMRWFNADERGLALGIRQTAPILGAAAAAAALPTLAIAFGTRGCLLTLAGGMLIGAVMSGAGLRTTGSTSSAAISGLRTLLDRRVWHVTTAGMFSVTAQFTLTVYLVQYLVHERHFDLRSAAAVLTACQLLGAAARIAAGWWSDRLHSRAIPMRGLTLASTLGLILLAAALRGPTPLTGPLFIIVFILAASTYGLFTAAVGEIAGPHRAGSAAGLLNTGMFAAGALAPIGIGAVIASAGWQVGILALAGLNCISWLLTTPLPALEKPQWDTHSPDAIEVPASGTASR